MRKIRVLRLRGVVWLELSPGRVSVDMCGKECGGVVASRGGMHVV